MNPYQQIIYDTFGFKSYKSFYQQNAIEIILQGKHKDYIVNMASQGGKSLCYQLLGLTKDRGFTVIIVPALALIHDHKNYLNSLGRGMIAEAINSNIDFHDRDNIRVALKAEGSELRFLFLTPEIIEMNGIMHNALLHWMQNGLVNYFIIDEAHKVIDAANYRKSYLCLKDLRKLNPEITWIALTTANPNLPIAQELSMDNPLVLLSSSVRDNIFYDSITDGTQEGNTLEDFLNELRSKEGKIPSGLIFTNWLSIIDNVVKYLNTDGDHIVEAYRNQQSVEKWRNGDFPILVASGKKFGFGINFQVPAIRFVIHLGMPDNIRSFYHESSRAGSDGNLGYSRVYGKIGLLENEQFLDPFINYEGAPCKRKYLTAHFGEEIVSCINMCDACLRNNNP